MREGVYVSVICVFGVGMCLVCVVLLFAWPQACSLGVWYCLAFVARATVTTCFVYALAWGPCIRFFWVCEESGASSPSRRLARFESWRSAPQTMRLVRSRRSVGSFDVYASCGTPRIVIAATRALS